MYLDNNATTPIDPLVKEAMIEAFDLYNPSSVHAYGRKAKEALIEARCKIAAYFTISPKEIIFTSSGTEAMNLLIRGLYKNGPIITTKIEHACVHNTIQAITDTITYIPVDESGRPKEIPTDGLTVLSAANNETGVMFPLNELPGPAIIDGVALLGKEPILLPHDVSIAFSAHKFHGPKGIGFAICRSPLTPQITGGAQEYNLRSGTENLPAIIGLAKAIELIPKTHIMKELRDYFESSLQKELDISINGRNPRVCNTSNIAFHGIDNETLLIALDMAGLAASAGSACSAGALEPSRVLLNMGYSMERANSSVRFSLSRMTTKEEINEAIRIIINTTRQLLQ